MATTKTTHVRTLIIGGGITGLATACALEQQGAGSCLVLEASPRVGGLCATTFAHGYHFDYGGHFLHVHTPQGEKWIKQLLGNNLQSHPRRAFVYTNGQQVPYPFQANLWALRPELRQLIERELAHPAVFPNSPANYEEWCIQSFGYSVYEAFFRPYNQKLWGRALTDLSYEWCGPFTPLVSHAEMLNGLHHPPSRPQGYNTQFYYPKTGGCGALVQALAARVSQVRVNTPLTRLNLEQKTAFSNREKFTFEQIVSTIPLRKLVELLDGNAGLKKAATRLEVQPITVYHLAIARRVKDFSWIYFPDWAQPFYRVGLTNYVAPGSVPHPDTSLFYIELPGLVSTTAQTEQRIWNGLYQKGLVNQDDVPLFSYWQPIPYAYVVFNKQHAQTVPPLLHALEQKHCYCAGRYGRWEYSFMESSLLQALELARRLAN